MTVRLREVVRSDVEGGLSGPANPIPSQSIDCGCGQMQCPKLAKFATRKLFVGLICWVGVVQAASHAYFYVTGSTIARKFLINPYLMDWILVTADLTPFILGLIIAYWGDRIHRASWIGALTLLESVAYFVLIIPHLTHRVHVTDETPNTTHMSLYADDSPELCNSAASKIIMKEDETCYFTMVTLIIVLIISGASNIAYYALGISYLDDNTKKKHVTGFIGVIIAVRIIGVLLGYLLGWGCLRIDAENLSVVKSYRDHIGAWWLGFPILSVLLIVPGLLLSWFPRRLPSEVVEQAAASLLDRAAVYNRAPHRTTYQKAGSPNFGPSLVRLITNKILMCNVLATVFCATALLNFMTHEDIFLESRFHIARPTGMFLGFNDPLQSRLITNITKPILIGLIVIISGLVLAKAKPRARFIVGYSFFALLFSTMIIILLIFVTCEKPPIVGMDQGSIGLLKYCNKNCRCSKDAEFRPVCESLGTYTYYNPCYAGCTTVIYVNNEKIYSGCGCVEYMTGWGNDQAKEGPCDSKCQAGWMLFQFGTSVSYALIASTFVGELLINIRSVYKQDKAISIGFWMTCIAIFVNGPGKILYEIVSYQACQLWGRQRIICHLHDGEKLGSYLCYLTIFFLSLSLVFKIIVWCFSKNLRLYEDVEREVKKSGEIQELMEQPKILEETETPINNNNTTAQVETIDIEPESISSPETTMPEENLSKKGEENTQKNTPLKYGPLGSGDRRVTAVDHSAKSNSQATIQNLDSEDELSSSSDESKKRSSPQVAYTPLELDSDIESDLSSTGPRSRKRVSSKDYDHTYNHEDDSSSSKNSSIKRRFPNPDHYEDPQRARYRKQNGYQDGSRKTTSFEFQRKGQESDVFKQGDFNEVGIPIVGPLPDGKGDSADTNTAHSTDVKSLIDQYEQNASQETIDEDQLSVRSAEDTKTRTENKIVSGIPLVAMVPSKQSPRQQSSASSGSSPDVQDKNTEQRSGKHTPSPKGPAKGGKPTYCTDL